MLITDGSFVVTDTETTGLSAGEDRLIDVAAVRIVDGSITERFSELINPQRAIPSYITRLTGITNAMVTNAAPAGEVLGRYLAFLGNSVLVAHNLSFDMRFLNAELAAARMSALNSPTICTLRLARRLLPGLRSKSLRSLTEFYRIENGQAHRALGDAAATAEVLLRLLERLRAEHGLEQLDDLLRFQFRPYRSSSRSPHLGLIRRTILPQISTGPGVYFMKNASGACIYVGKARNLRARVSSYFSAIEAHDPKTRKMMDVVRSVDWQETATELEAMLLESRLIKELRPRFNRAHVQYRSRPFLRLSSRGSASSVTITPVLKDDGASYFGPIENKVQAERMLRVIRLLYKGADRARVTRFLDGEDDTVLHALHTAMRRAADAMQYETAAELRDLAETVSRTLEHQGCIAPSVLDHNGVLVLSDGERNQVNLHFVRFGRTVQTMILSPSEGPALADRLRTNVAMHFDGEQSAPARYYVEEIDEVRILRQWARSNRQRVTSIPWHTNLTTDAFCAQIVEAAQRALPGAARESASIDGSDARQVEIE